MRELLYRIERKKILMYGLLLLGTIIFFFRSAVSSRISLYDEMAYILTALQLHSGTISFVDDWSVIQLFGYVTLPFVSMFVELKGSTEGIVLFLRGLYLLIKLIVAVWAIRRIHNCKANEWIGFLAVLFFFCFTPYNIDTLSYNTVSIMMVFMMVIMLETDLKYKRDYFGVGLFLAIAILAQPFYCLLYPVFLIGFIIQKKFDRYSGKELRSNILCFSLGVFVIAVIVGTYILSRASIGEVFYNLPHIFTNKDHSVGVGGGNAIFSIVISFLEFFLIVLKGFWIYTIISIITIAVLVFGKLKFKKKIILCTLKLVLCICYILLQFKQSIIENIFWVPFFWYCLEIIIIFKSYHSIFTWILISFACSCTGMGTNTGILSISAVECVYATLAVVIIAKHKTDEYDMKGIWTIYNLMLIVIVGLHIFILWDRNIEAEDFDSYIEVGPLKGTYTSEELYYFYYDLLNEVDSFQISKEDKALFATYEPTVAVHLDTRMAGIFFYEDYERIKEYYEFNSDNIPDFIYFEKPVNIDSAAIGLSDAQKDLVQYIFKDSEYYLEEGERAVLAVRNN